MIVSHETKTLPSTEDDSADEHKEDDSASNSDAEKGRGHHGFKVLVQVFNSDIGENIYIVKKNVRDFVNSRVLSRSRGTIFLRFVAYMSKISRQYLRNLKLINKKDFDLEMFSAEIDDGLWDKPRFSIFSHLLRDDDIENI
jgi:hypothetical protein